MQICLKLFEDYLLLRNFVKIFKMKDIIPQYKSCPIRQVITRFGDKWSMLVLYSINKSQNGVLSYNELKKLMADCSQKMLTQTLEKLEHNNLIKRTVYPQMPPKVEYSLTPMALTLMPIIDKLVDWAGNNLNEFKSIY